MVSRRDIGFAVLALTIGWIVTWNVRAQLPPSHPSAPAQHWSPMMTLAHEVPLHLRPRVFALNRAAVDNAYQQQITHLFLVWMKDEHDQPERAAKGAQQALRGYIESMAAIDSIEKQLSEQAREQPPPPTVP